MQCILHKYTRVKQNERSKHLATCLLSLLSCVAVVPTTEREKEKLEQRVETTRDKTKKAQCTNQRDGAASYRVVCTFLLVCREMTVGIDLANLIWKKVHFWVFWLPNFPKLPQQATWQQTI